MKGSEAFMSKINTGGQDQLSNIDDAKKEADEAADMTAKLEAEGFKCALSCSLNYPKILFLSVSCRDPEASMGNKKLRLRT